jgi:hypothetical protein
MLLTKKMSMIFLEIFFKVKMGILKRFQREKVALELWLTTPVLGDARIF